MDKTPKKSETAEVQKTSGTDEKPKVFRSNQEFIHFLFTRMREKKKWWLFPLLLLLIFLAYFFNLPGKESILPALYFLF